MTSLEMYQKFQVYLDKIDSQDLPEIWVDEAFIFLNSAVDEYVQGLRQSFELSGKIGDDGSTLVKRLFIEGFLEEDRVLFDYTSATIRRGDVVTTPVYYLLNGVFDSSYQKGDQVVQGKTGITYTQQDDIQPVLEDPFANIPQFFDKVLCVREYPGLIANKPQALTLHRLVGTFIIKPAIISQEQDCNLPEQTHETIVKRAVEMALENVESIRQKTFNQ
jgi:hypothetical protein